MNHDPRPTAYPELAAAFAELPDDQRRGMAVVFAEYAAGYVVGEPELSRVYAALAVVAAAAPDLPGVLEFQRAVASHLWGPQMLSDN